MSLYVIICYYMLKWVHIKGHKSSFLGPRGSPKLVELPRKKFGKNLRKSTTFEGVHFGGGFGTPKSPKTIVKLMVF